MASKHKAKPRRQPIVVIGGGGHAKVLLALLSRLREYEVLGYVDPRDHGDILGYSRLGGDEALPDLAKKRNVAAVLGIGKVKAESARMKMFSDLSELGFALPPVVAVSAVVSPDTVLGEGSVVMEGAVVQPGCVIGLGAILNTNSVVEHDCVLGDDVHVGPGAALSGNVNVGDGCLVGVGASLIQGVRVVGGCTIGAGAAVTTDCLDAGVYVGVPARRAGA